MIKVEDPRAGGDAGRYVPPYQSGEDSLFFEARNRCKRSVSIDLGTPAGQEAFRALAVHVDAVFCNLWGDVPEKLGLTYRHLSAIDPTIVCCSLSAFGSEGELRDVPGYDYLLQGMAGWMSVTGEPEGPPTKSGLSLVDFSASHTAGLALLSGIHAARRDGVGLDCDLALFDVAVGMLNYVGTWHLTAGHEPQRTSYSPHPSLTPFQNLKAADGWLVVAGAKEMFWRRLTQALDCPELLEDERFATFSDRAANTNLLIPHLAELIASQTVAEVVARLRQAGVPCAPTLSVSEALSQPLTRQRRMIVSYPHPVHDDVRTIGSPLKVGPRRAELKPAPRCGEHTDPVMRSLAGLSADRIDHLRERGAFGPVEGTRGRDEEH